MADSTEAIRPGRGSTVSFRGLTTFLRRDTNVVIATVVLSNLIRMVGSALLTRLLVPEAFGIVGLIGSIAFILSMVSDLGFQAFVIRHRDGNVARFLDVIWTIRFLRAAALCGVLMLLAEPVAALLGKPEIALAIAVSSLQFLIEGLSSLALVTALRERQLPRLSALEIIGMIVQVAVSIVLAWAWQTYWSIVVAILVSHVVRTVLSYVMFPQSGRRLRFDRAYATELGQFARFVTGSSIISMLLMQSDKVVLGRLLSLDQLGLYMLAANLAMAPLAFTYGYASRVLYPAYARVWHDAPETLKTVFYTGRWKVSVVYMLATGGLIGVAPLIVGVLYDPRYATASIYLRLLAITPMLALASVSANEVLTASGRVQVTFHANIAKLVWFAVAGPAAFWLYGPIGLVACVGTLEAPTLLYSWVQLRRYDLLDMRRELELMGMGVAGVAIGYGASAVLSPFV